MTNGSKGACLVVGAGDDTGAAIARAFAREGMTACVVRRPRHADALDALARWPDWLEAQYVTAGPNPGKANITVRRVDGAVFDLTAFTVKLLANAGAGRAREVVPLLNGEEPLNDPLYFDGLRELRQRVLL